MAKVNRKKVLDILPPSKSKTIQKNKIAKEEITYKTPKQLEEIFLTIESQKSQFIQEVNLTSEPEINKPLSENESLIEKEPIAEEKNIPSIPTTTNLQKETQSQEQEEEFIDKESVFKELEKELEYPNVSKKIHFPLTKKPISSTPNKHIRRFLFTLSSIIISGIIFYYLGFIILPKADIYITAKKVNLTKSDFTVLVDKNVNQIDVNQQIIPGNLFTFSESITKDFNSTGQGKDDRPAKGTIIIFNNFSTAPQILIATTRFEHPSGKIYRLDSRIVVPGAIMENGKLKPSSIEATVTADQLGPEYNIDSCNNSNNCKFTIPAFKGTSKYEGFYAISNEPISGGSKGAVPMVTNQDLKNAEQTLLDELNTKIEDDIKNKIPSELKIINTARSSLQINKITSTANAGDYRQTFSESLTGEVDVLAFKESDLVNLIKEINNKIKPDKYSYCENPKIEYKDATADFKKGQLKLTLSYTMTLCYSLNTDEIKNSIKGKALKDLNLILNSFDGIENVKVKLYPFWLRKVPEKENKIHIFID